MALVCRESSSSSLHSCLAGAGQHPFTCLMRGAVVSFLLYSLDTCACASDISCKHVRTLDCKKGVSSI